MNIGAGTITCNYDGFEKHKTSIGAGAFIGSNATLVTPIDVGDGSYVGAGSVITDPVPPDTLALSPRTPGKQRGWVKKKASSSDRIVVGQAVSPASKRFDLVCTLEALKNLTV